MPTAELCSSLRVTDRFAGRLSDMTAELSIRLLARLQAMDWRC